jgi:subtilisin-like proprotein convertase family protein
MKKSPLLAIIVVVALLSLSLQSSVSANKTSGKQIESTQATFSNTASITIADRASGTGAPPGLPALYPSTINATGMTGVVSKVTVTLTFVNHPYPLDLDILLVGPTGARTILMSDAGGTSQLSGRIYTFDQTVNTDFPDDITPANGTYRPANYSGDPMLEPGSIDNFPAPGPGSLNYGTPNLNVFNNTNPNGTWGLYAVDDENVDAGNIFGGWTINITTVVKTRVADFDGDGKSDLSIFRPPVGQWWFQRSSDGVVPAYTFGTATDKITPGDYDGDGKTDVAFFRPSTTEWFVLRSSNLTFFAAPFGNSTDIPAPADFDGDAKTDLGVYRASIGTWFILKSSDNGVLTVPFGIAQDIPQPSDYDGDGKADVGVYRPTGGSGNAEWWILKSSGGIFATPFGSATDKPVPGDYTGDGKSDVAFWRSSTSEWFILRSEDLSFFAAPFGSSSDTPAPADYDGDGKFDLTVFRSSIATWFVLKSTGGTTIQQFGATGDRPVASAFIP